MGLVVLGILAIFMCGGKDGDGPDESRQPQRGEEEDAQQAMQQQGAQQQGMQHSMQQQGMQQDIQQQALQAQPQMQQAVAPQGVRVLEPKDAEDFVSWWQQGAFNYNPKVAQENHQLAYKWMNPGVQGTFQQLFWTNEIAQGIASGSLVGSFQPVSVHAQAINPNGTVVVSLAGVLVIQRNGYQPETRQIFTDYLVKREPQGLRITGMYNRAIYQTPTAYNGY